MLLLFAVSLNYLEIQIKRCICEHSGLFYGTKATAADHNVRVKDTLEA